MSSQDLFAPSPETLRQCVNLTPKDLEPIGMQQDQIDGFLTLRKRFLQKPLVDWEKVDVVPDEFLVQYSDLTEADPTQIKAMLNKLVVVQLNGGLGTMMGMKGPKSGLQILKKSNNGNGPVTILDCKINHIEGLNKEFDVDIPLVLMNSFNTDEETKKMIERYSGRRLTIHTCMQSQYPMMFKDTLSPVPTSINEKQCFYPPGSGEVFSVLLRSGLLKTFKEQGKDFLFISNVENLGATVDLSGIPIRYKKDERVHVLELSQVPYDFMFQERHVVHIETPAAMAIHSFRRSAGLFVPRTRYFPILTTAHLLMAQSELFELNQKGELVMHSRREPPTVPLVKLGSSFQTLPDYEKRFDTIPNISELDHLTVSGDVIFGSNVTLKGTVIIVAEPGSLIHIPSGTILENKVVSGTLILRDN